MTRRAALVSLLVLCTIGARAQQPVDAGTRPVFVPYKASGVYAVGEKVGWTISPPATAALATTTFNYVVTRNDAVVVSSGKLDLSSGPAVIETAIDEPAMVLARIRPGDTTTGPSINVGAAVAPEKLQPVVPRPADFDAFWEGKLKAQADVAINPSLTPVETTVAGVDLFTVKLDALGSHVQGYLARPSREGKFPALVIYQYAGVYALQPRTVTDRAAEGWLAFDVDAHDMPPDQATAPRNYQAVGNTDRETSYFLDMYLRDARAIDYIAGRPDWDGRAIVVMGTSMGGQQSVVAAALNPRVTAVLVNEPAGADTNADLHGRKAGYPNWPSTDPKIMQAALYFDTVNFAPRITAPIAAAIGFIDGIAPPAGIWTMLNQVPAPREAIPMIESDHNNITPDKQGAWDARWRAVLAGVLRGDAFHPDDTWTRR